MSGGICKSRVPSTMTFLNGNDWLSTFMIMALNKKTQTITWRRSLPPNCLFTLKQA